jgi:acetyl-CoA synthetase/medium-chain acyl-CoA synthetase
VKTTETPFADVPTYFNFAHDVVEKWAAQCPEALALWWIDEPGTQERKITFAQIARDARKAAGFFASLNIRRGDRVMLILPRVPEWWVVMLGLIRLGAVPIPGTPLLTARDVAYRLHIAEVGTIITDAANAAKIPETFAGNRVIVGSDLANWTRLESGLATAADDLPYTPTLATDPGIIYFTSGTAGEAKMVLHTQVSYGLGHTITGKYWLDLSSDDMIWALADTGWGKTAWSNFFGPWIQGAAVFSMDMRGKFDPNLILKTLERYPISVFCAPATALRLIVRKNLAACRFAKLRHCVSAGEALNPPVAAAWKAGTGLTIYEGYGQTETVCLIGYFRALGDLEPRTGSMGRAAPGFDIRIVDEEGHEVPAGKAGQIAVRVKPQRPLAMFQEYWKNPDETAGRYVGDFYLTGDTGYRDSAGYFYFVGRADDVINSASYRIGPSEVESALQEHPSVLESAAIGVPEELRGEIVQAYVVLRQGFEASAQLKRELQAHCKRVTAPYKYPRQIVFVPELPKTVSGKIRRVELRARAAAEAKSTRARIHRRRKFLRYVARVRRFFGINS